MLHRQSDGGHSVVVIEHDQGVIAEADLVVALGPNGGDAGGLIVAEGAPEAVAAGVHMGQAFARVFERS